MTKTPAQLDREIAQTILPPAVMRKWNSKIGAYKRAISKLEAGYSDELFKVAARARDALDKTINDAAAYVPYTPGQSPYLSEALQALERERKQLVSSSTLQQADERGREANYQRSRVQLQKLKEEEREAQRPITWMRHSKIAKDLSWGPVKTSEQPPVAARDGSSQRAMSRDRRRKAEKSRASFNDDTVPLWLISLRHSRPMSAATWRTPGGSTSPSAARASSAPADQEVAASGRSATAAVAAAATEPLRQDLVPRDLSAYPPVRVYAWRCRCPDRQGQGPGHAQSPRQ